MASLRNPQKSQHRDVKAKPTARNGRQHPQLDLPKSLRRGDLEFDVRDLLSEIRSMSTSERERLIRSYA